MTIWLQDEFSVYTSTYEESNFGRHIGVQDSAALNDSAELMRLIIICKSIGCRKYFLIRTSVTSWLLAIINANTRS